MVLPKPRPLKPPSRQWASWFLRQYGWSLLSRGNDTQLSLPYCHEDMRRAREAYRALVDDKGVHGALVLNFDQLWRTAWGSNSKLLFKTGCPGEPSQKSKAGARTSKKIDAVKHQRRGMTAVTTSWSDGTAGPIAFCVPEGRISAEEMAKFNKEHRGRSYVLSSGSKTHFLTADTLLILYEQLFSPALMLQRQRHVFFGGTTAMLALLSGTGGCSNSKHLELAGLISELAQGLGFRVSGFGFRV